MAKARKPAFRVGLLGESPNDTKAMEALLKPRYGQRVEFFTLLRNVTGDMLEYAETFRNLRKEYEWEKPNLVIAIRDLDTLETKGAKWRQRQAYFRKVATVVEQKSLPLLHIYEIEALICADIAKFNATYGCACEVPADPMTIAEPKERLMAATPPGKPRYAEGHCAKLLAEVSYDMLLTNCRYFAEFDLDFSQRIPA
jgi:hypothetical protein